MGIEDQDAIAGRLLRQHRDSVQERVRVVETLKQVSEQLRRLADAIDRTPDFEQVSKDSILQKYLDLSRIASLVIEERELTTKIQDYQKRLSDLGFAVSS